MSASDPDVGDTDSDVLTLLERFVRKRLGADAVIEGFARVSTGRSRQNWLFDAVWTDNGTTRREPLIVRRDPLGGLLETDRADEFAVLQALESAPIPTPKARWLDATGSELGRPCLVMVRIEGTCDYYALNGAAPLADRIDLAARLCSLLAEVHAVDWKGVGLDAHLTDPGPMASLAALDQWESILRRDQLEPYPELEIGAQWLRSNAPRSPRTVLVHADFKVGNVLLDADGRIAALLDWEIAHLGDPHEDLGWVTQPLRTREHYIRGSWEREELLDRYERASGHPVDREAVVWWNAFAAYKTAVMQVSGLRAFREGRSDEHYRPSAPVLRTLLTHTIAPGSPAEATAAEHPVFSDSASFLRWDTRETLTLVHPETSAEVSDSDPVADPSAANHLARAALVGLIGSPGPGRDDVRRTEIVAHLLERVSRNPELARRPR